MIRRTFSILNGIGERLEKRLWREGILTWGDFINSPRIDFLNPLKKNLYDSRLSEALIELANANAEYFAASVKKREHWRLFERFRGDAVCLDIETNGLMPGSGGYVTMVGMFDGFDYKCFLKDENLSPGILKKELSGYKYLITFYGAGFDIPFLMRSMPGLKFNIPHFDICFGARKIGFRGGLKKLETELGIFRDDSVRNMDGYDAVKLWEQSQRGSREALDLLRTYNREDTVNLCKIADIVYHRMRAQTGIEEYL